MSDNEAVNRPRVKTRRQSGFKRFPIRDFFAGSRVFVEEKRQVMSFDFVSDSIVDGLGRITHPFLTFFTLILRNFFIPTPLLVDVK